MDRSGRNGIPVDGIKDGDSVLNDLATKLRTAQAIVARAGDDIAGSLARVADIKEQVESKTAELESKTARVLELDGDITRLQTRKEAAEAESATKLAELTRIRQELHDAMERKAVTDNEEKARLDKIKELEKREEHLRKLIDGKEDAQEKLDNELDAKRTELAQLVRGITERTKTNGELAQERAALVRDNAVLGARNNELAAINNGLREAEQEHREDERLAKKQTEEMARREVAHGNAGERLHKALLDVQDAEQASAYLERKIAEQRQLLERGHDEELLLRKGNTQLRAEQSAVEKELARLEAKKAEVERRIAEAQREWEAAQAAGVLAVQQQKKADGQAKEAESKLAGLIKKTADVVKEADSAVRRQAEAEQARALAEAARETANFDAAALRALRNGLTVGLDMQRAQMIELGEQIGQLKDERDTAAGEASEAKRKRASQADALKKLEVAQKEEIAKHAAQLEGLNAQIAAKKADMEKMDEELLKGAGAKEVALIEKLKKEIADLTKQRDGMIKAAEQKVQAAIAAAEAKQKVAEEAERAAQANLDKANAELAAMNGRIGNLQGSINALDGINKGALADQGKLNEELARVKAALTTIKEEQEQREKAIKEAEEKLSGITTAASVAEIDLARIRDKRDAFRKRVDSEVESRTSWSSAVKAMGKYATAAAVGATVATSAEGLQDLELRPEQDFPIVAKKMPDVGAIQRNPVSFIKESFRKNPVGAVGGGVTFVLGVYVVGLRGHRKNLLQIVDEHNKDIEKLGEGPHVTAALGKKDSGEMRAVGGARG